VSDFYVSSDNIVDITINMMDRNFSIRGPLCSNMTSLSQVLLHLPHPTFTPTSTHHYDLLAARSPRASLSSEQCMELCEGPFRRFGDTEIHIHYVTRYFPKEKTPYQPHIQAVGLGLMAVLHGLTSSMSAVIKILRFVTSHDERWHMIEST